MITVRCTEACLGLAHSQCPRLVLSPEAPRVLAPRDLSQKNATMSHYINAMNGVQRVIRCMLMHNLPILTSFSHLLLYP
jgi:hypothetical protein